MVQEIEALAVVIFPFKEPVYHKFPVSIITGSLIFSHD